MKTIKLDLGFMLYPCPWNGDQVMPKEFCDACVADDENGQWCDDSIFKLVYTPREGREEIWKEYKTRAEAERGYDSFADIDVRLTQTLTIREAKPIWAPK